MRKAKLMLKADLLAKVYSLPYPVGIWNPKNDAHGVAAMRGVGGIPRYYSRARTCWGPYTESAWESQKMFHGKPMA